MADAENPSPLPRTDSKKAIPSSFFKELKFNIL